MPNRSRSKASPDPPQAAGEAFPIVGVGASAGGLEAFTALLRNLPADTGMGFVLVQHLDPHHESALTELLAKTTSMPVGEAAHDQRVQANRVYIIPPNTNLTMAQGVLQIQPRRQTRLPHHSIDIFLESLARDQHERAIGVILSGAATDGTLGLETIKAEGGITFAQDESARFDSMPRSAVASGCADFVLSPQNIALELARIARHPYVAGKARLIVAPGEGAEALGRDASGEPAGNDYRRILLLLRNHRDVDFSLYKPPTIERRIMRRMVLHRQATLADYATYLRGNTKELDALYADMLISVTSFFRNPEAFENLKRTVFVKPEPADEPFRVWVLGCSTGQEAYSIAMAFVESAEKAPRLRRLQVFATDINEALLEKARQGLYAKSLVADVSPQRLRRFFAEERGGYRVKKALRDMIVFARQDLISDPPFSRLDLISCRNLLIYLEPSVQKQVFPTFHYALKPNGFLFLGASESIGGFTELFEPVHKKHKLYFRKAGPTPAFHLAAPRQRTEYAGRREPLGAKTLTAPAQGDPGPAWRAGRNAEQEADRVSVDQFAPPGVLINADLQILQFRGKTSAYLEPPYGKASFDLLKMARGDLMLPLRAAINKAKKENKRTRKEHVGLQQDGVSRTVNLDVIPLKNLREPCFLVLFEEPNPTPSAAQPASVPEGSLKPSRAKPRDTALRIAETELAETREYLQAIQEQHEAANEELQSAHEEVQSANEELQSLNEELETSKEELESANEELITVNQEMTHHIAELGQLNDDLTNVQKSAHLAIVVVGRDLSIRRFTAQAEKIAGLLASDVGRPIDHIRHPLVFPETGKARDLGSFAAGVIASVREDECEVHDTTGHWYSLRVRPYITADNKVDGAVLVLVDIDALKRNEQVIADARDYAEHILDSVRDPLLVLDAQLRIERANHAFSSMFRIAPAAVVGKSLFELGNRQFEIPRLRILLGEILPQNTRLENFEVEDDFQQLGRRCMLLNARCVDDPVHGTARILLSFEDITQRKSTEEEIRQLAFHDALTALPNRMLFSVQLAQAIQHAKRECTHVAALFLDLDHFKRVNDTLGHTMGDLLLQGVAQRLSHCVRGEDSVTRGEPGHSASVARLGGDEFIVMLTDITEPRDAARVAQRIIEAFRKIFSISGHEISVSASIGIALYPADGDDIETLLKHADAAMYHAKGLGRGRYQFYNHAIYAAGLARLELENDMHSALEKDEFVLHYQPVWDDASGQVIGAEALVRWQHPGKGQLMPSEFITVAEETGIINALGAWVLASACRQNRAWQSADMPPVPISVNISSVQLRQPDFSGLVKQVLLDSGLAPQYLMLEVTESLLIEDLDAALLALQQLRELGIHIAIDDFGTGFSSLMYLKRLAVDTLKIDQCFVKNVGTDQDNAAIVSAVIALARELKLNVVAEGVETQQEREFLQARGCSHMQGFLFGQPLPALQFANLLSSPTSLQ
ncbi:MAG: EAL domain-containing protein [Burkholderiales bacterium]